MRVDLKILKWLSAICDLASELWLLALLIAANGKSDLVLVTRKSGQPIHTGYGQLLTIFSPWVGLFLVITDHVTRQFPLLRLCIFQQ
jgi:hypothetical protein